MHEFASLFKVTEDASGNKYYVLPTGHPFDETKLNTGFWTANITFSTYWDRWEAYVFHRTQQYGWLKQKYDLDVVWRVWCVRGQGNVSHTIPGN